MFNLAGEISGLMLDMDVFAIILPHSEIDYDARLHPQGIFLGAETPEASAIREMLETTVALLPGAQRSEAALYAERARALIRPLFHNHIDRLARPKPLRRQILDYVDEQIFAEDFTIDNVMQAFEMSRGRTYGLLDLAVPLDTLIAIRRLDYALRSLAFGRKDRARLGLIAKRLGYRSPKDFAGAFNMHFGFPPETVLGVLNSERPEVCGGLWSTWLDDGAEVGD